MLYGQNLLGQNNSVSKVKLFYFAFFVSKYLGNLFFFNKSIPAAPNTPPPGYCGAFARLVSPEGGAFVGGVTRPMLPYLPGVPHLHVNRLLNGYVRPVPYPPTQTFLGDAILFLWVCG